MITPITDAQAQAILDTMLTSGVITQAQHDSAAYKQGVKDIWQVVRSMAELGYLVVL